MRNRFASLYLFGLVFLLASLALRVGLLVRSWGFVSTSFPALAAVFAIGLLFDLIALCVCGLPGVLLLTLMPDRVVRSRLFAAVGAAVYSACVFVIFYCVAIEWFFWDEYASRLNFLALDYLKDSREVVSSIWESYPVVPVTAGLLALTAGVIAATVRPVLRSYQATCSRKSRVWLVLIVAAVAAVSPVMADSPLTRKSPNPFNNNLAQNGVLTFMAAMAGADIHYEQVYVHRDDQDVLGRLREQLATFNSQYMDSDPSLGVTRRITGRGPEIPRNVVIVVVESLSAEFLGSFGSKAGLTPNLDALVGEGVAFTNLYAAGNRTIRGLEALNLSLPPTPGRSIIKRRGANKLFSAQRIFTAKGYKTEFLYGGFARFDHMDEFLSGGAFETIDRGSFSADEVTFENAWGVCDEDLYNRAIKECDKAHAQGRPLFAMLMTTSNHRPFTYPQKIDIPSGSGSDGAVKYSDYAIGQFIRQARTRPWFANTVVLIVADHCSRNWSRNMSGTDGFHIPAILLAPGLVNGGANSTLCSQIDLVPTILGLLNFSYKTKFFGRDILADPPGRAFVGMPDWLGYIEPSKMVRLEPGCRVHAYDLSQADGPEVSPDEAMLTRAITYYQGAGYLLVHHLFNAD